MDKPMIFSTDMVRAILTSKKTVTRRVAKGKKPRWSAGDRLWVRETFVLCAKEEFKPPLEADEVFFKAGSADDFPEPYSGMRPCGTKWKPSIHMPKKLSRIHLKVISVNVENLQDIDQDDAVREGVNSVKEYAKLWDRINGKRAPWKSNPKVWRIKFETVAK